MSTCICTHIALTKSWQVIPLKWMRQKDIRVDSRVKYSLYKVNFMVRSSKEC